MCTWLGKGKDPCYTLRACFETFPFPPGLRLADTAKKTDSKNQANVDQSQSNNSDANDKDAAPFNEPAPAIIANPTQRLNAQTIAEAAFKLNQLRDSWLNPPEWVDWVITPEEEQAGFPKRPVAKPGHEAELKKRTLTNLYNARPAWLDNAHLALDKAVAKAYGWDDYTPGMSDGEVLQRLLKLNLTR